MYDKTLASRKFCPRGTESRLSNAAIGVEPDSDGAGGCEGPGYGGAAVALTEGLVGYFNVVVATIIGTVLQIESLEGQSDIPTIAAPQLPFL